MITLERRKTSILNIIMSLMWILSDLNWFMNVNEESFHALHFVYFFMQNLLIKRHQM